MKRTIYFVMALALLLALLPTTVFAHTEDAPFVTDLLAGQDMDVGEVQVWNDGEYLYVKYIIDDPEWCLNQTHVHVADTLEGIPQTKKFNPIPGKFDYVNDWDCTDEALITVPLGWATGTNLKIATHAVVSSSPVCSTSAIVYGTDRPAGDIYEIDLSAGTANMVFSTSLVDNNPNSPNGNAYDPSSGRLYYSWNKSPEAPPNVLYYYDFAGNQVSAGTTNGFVAGAAFHNGTYYYIANRTDDLRAVNFDSNGAVLSDSMVYGDFTGLDEIFRFGDIAIKDGILYGSAQVRNGTTDAILRVEFFTIDLATGTYTKVATVDNSAGTRQLAFGSDGTLYGHNAGGGMFYTVDTATGVETPIGTILDGNDVPREFTDLASGALCVPETETAWGDGQDFAGKNWATYFTYEVQLIVGSWDATRGDLSSFATTNAFADARSALEANYSVGYMTFNQLNSDLSKVHVAILGSVKQNESGNPISSLSSNEQEALMDFVETGGCAILLTDGMSFNTGNNSLTAPFGLSTVGMFNAPKTANIVDNTFTSETTFKTNYPGYYNTGVGTQLANFDPGNQVAAVWFPREIGSSRGPVFAFSDINMFWNVAYDIGGAFFSENEQLFLDTIDACLN